MNKTNPTAEKEKSIAQENNQSFAKINTRSFLFVTALLLAILLITGALSYFIPGGSFDRDENGALIEGTYEIGEIDGIAVWRILTAPVRVFFAPGCITIIMISVFVMIMSGVFNLVEKTHGIHIFMHRIVKRFSHRKKLVCCLCVLAFMLFGSFFGMFEELVTLLPFMVMFALSLGLDTLTGLCICLVGACFGFAAAITNPFSVELIASFAGTNMMDGVWLRIVFFLITYGVLCAFLLRHVNKIEKKPSASLTFELDEQKRIRLEKLPDVPEEKAKKILRAYGVFVGIQLAVLLAIAFVRAISGFAVPILAASFLFGGIACGLVICENKKDPFRYLWQGIAAMAPAVIMIGIASSVRLVLEESGIMDTVVHGIIQVLGGRGPFVSILLIFLLILLMQVFIDSASAKIILIIPILLPVCATLGVSIPTLTLAYCLADGFTNVFVPTGPVLLIGLSMADVSYGKWVRFTWKLQAVLLALSILVLFFASKIGY